MSKSKPVSFIDVLALLVVALTGATPGCGSDTSRHLPPLASDRDDDTFDREQGPTSSTDSAGSTATNDPGGSAGTGPVVPSSTAANVRPGPAVFVLRGIVADPELGAQENTADAVGNILEFRRRHPDDRIDGVEISVMVTEPDATVVLCHDLNLLYLTGQDIEMQSLRRAEIEQLRLKTEIGGVAYDRPRPFAFLDEVLLAYIPSGMRFWFSVKGAYNTVLQSAPAIIEVLLRVRTPLLAEYGIDVLDRVLLFSANPLMSYHLARYAEKRGVQEQMHVAFDYGSLHDPTANQAYEELIAAQHYERLLNLRDVVLESLFVSQKVIDDYRSIGVSVNAWGLAPGSDFVGLEGVLTTR